LFNPNVAMKISTKKRKHRITVHMFHWIWSGLISEHEPFITTNKRLFFLKLTKTLHDYFGFRKPSKGETLEKYIAAFRDFEYKYRNDYDDLTDGDKSFNISKEINWDTEENEIVITTTKITV